MDANNTSPIIVALDYSDYNEAIVMAENLDPKLCRVKVGKELFTRAGPDVVKRLVSMGHDVFLDLKFHDIPNTTANAVLAAADLGAWMVNVHASGGQRMMEAAQQALDKRGLSTLLIGVTVLTSMEESDLEQIGMDGKPVDNVTRLATLAKLSGLDGVVCSAREASVVRAQLGDEFTLVTPGIRPTGSGGDDQRRIVTPVDAMNNGSDYLVIGRPITRSTAPTASLIEILNELPK